jgi:hypothetical protein
MSGLYRLRLFYAYISIYERILITANKRSARGTISNPSYPSSTANYGAQTRGGGRKRGIEQTIGQLRGDRETQKKPDTLETLIILIITEI